MFIFIHVPKSAGTSISHYYSQLTRVSDVEIGCTEIGEDYLPVHQKYYPIYNHIECDRLVDLMGGREVFERYYSFAFVRNPYARVIAFFNFWKDWLPKKMQEGGLPSNFVELAHQLSKHTSVDSFVCSQYWNSSEADSVLKSQYQFTHSESGDQLVKSIQKIEDLEQGIYRVNKAIGVDMGRFSLRLNRSKLHDPGLLSAEAVSCINVRHKGDFSFFDYEMADPSKVDQGFLNLKEAK